MDMLGTIEHLPEMASRYSVALTTCVIQLLNPDTKLASSLRAHWIPLAPNHNIYPRRSGHTAFQDDSATRTVPYIFGGYAEVLTESMSRYVVNDLWKWVENDWIQVDACGDIPGPRLVSASATCHDKAYLFGGWDPQTVGTGGAILDSVHKFDCATATWSTLPCRMPDGPTSRHVAVALNPTTNDGIIVVHTHRCADYVLLFDTVSHTFTKQATTGPCPSPRGLHTAALVNKHLCVFGGAAQDQSMSNECFLLDTITWRWTKPEIAGPCPTPRAGASLVALDSSSVPCVILFGGAEATATGLNPRADVWALSLGEPIRWTLLINDDDRGSVDTDVPLRPPPRNAATLSRIYSIDGNNNQKKKDFLLTGGWAPFRETRDDCYVLRVSRDDS